MYINILYRRKKDKRIQSKKDVPQHYLVEKSDEQLIIPYLRDLEDPPSPPTKLDASQIVTLSGSEATDLEFVKKTKDLKFPRLKKLTLWHLAFVNSPEELKVANEWLRYAFMYKLKYLELDSGLKRMSLYKLEEGLKNLLNLVTHQIYFARFKLDAGTLATVIEKSYNVKCLVLYNCQIDTVKDFYLNPCVDYNIKELDLFYTARKVENRFLSQLKFKKFVKALSKTNLKNSLTYVHVSEKEYPEREVQNIFDSYGFNLTVHGDDTCPLILEA